MDLYSAYHLKTPLMRWT